MIRRTSIVLLEFLAGLVAGSIVLLLVGAWWLWSGPVALTFLTPYIEEALSPEDSTIAVEIDETVLEWAGWNRAANLRVSNVQVLDLERRVIAELPKVSLGLSLQAILRGRIAPTYLEIIRPSVSVVRDADGGFVVGLAAGMKREASKPSQGNLVLEGLIAELLSEPNLSKPLGYLKRVGVVDADLTIDDQKLKQVWYAPRANIDLERNATGIGARVDVDLELDGERSKVTGIAVYTTESGSVDATINVVDFDPSPIFRSTKQPSVMRLSALGLRLNGSVGFRMMSDGAIRSARFDITTVAGQASGEVAVGKDGYGVSAGVEFGELRWSVLSSAFPVLSDIARVDVPINGSVTVQATTSGDLLSLDFDLAGGAGTIDLPQFYPEPLPVKKVSLRGQVSEGLRRVQIDNAGVTLESGEVVAHASATKVGDDWSLRLDGSVSDFSAPFLPRYWPPELAVDARDWVLANIRKGHVDEASISLVARLPDGDAHRADIKSLNGTIRLRDAAVDYFAQLPTVTGVRADMTYTEEGFDISVSDGRLRNLHIDEGSVVISGLDQEDQDISLDLVMRGPVRTAVEILDLDPLRFVSDLGFDAASISGQTAARLIFKFPLEKSLRIDKVAVAVGATLQNVSLENGPLGSVLSDGALELQLSGLGMRVSGKASLNGVPLDLSWEEKFSKAEKFQRRFTVSGSVGADARRDLGLPEFPGVSGEVSGEVAYTQFPDGHNEVVSKLDLTAVVLDAPNIHWRKPAGIPGSLYLFAITPTGGVPVIEDLKVEAADLKVSARAELSSDLKGVKLLEFRNLEFANNKIQGRVRVSDESGLDIQITGDRFDIEPFLGNGGEVDAIAYGRGDPLRIEARVDEVLLGEGRSLTDVSSFLESDGTNWRQIGVNAVIDNGIRLAVKYAPKGKGATLLISTTDAGLALQAANWSSRLKGGRLLVTGTQLAPGDPITGEFNLKEFKVTDAPALARVLQVLSLTGIFTLLNQEGLDFVKLDGNFRYYGGALEIKNARAFGSTIGITANGSLYLSEETADLNGTVVPAYTINSALGNIPVLGTILTGGKNEGVFAANYAVKGRLEDPRVSVNPLSALAPGFLRNLIGSEVKPLTGEDAVTPSQ